MVSNDYKAYLSGIALCGMVIALPGLYQIPFTQSDEYTYFSTARSSQVLLEWTIENWQKIIADDFDAIKLRSLYQDQQVSLSFPYYYKPLFDLIVLFSLYVFGYSLHSILYANIFSFAFSILFIGIIGRELLGKRIGIIAALLFMTSGSMLVQARTGMAHMPSIAILLAGILLYLYLLRGKLYGKKYWQVGFVWGAALAVHPTMLPFIFVIFFAGLFHFWRLGGLKSSIIHSIYLVTGISILFIFIESAYQIIGVLLEDVLASTRSWEAVAFRTYFEQILLHADSVVRGRPTILNKIYTYLGLYLAHEGIVVGFLATAASVYFLYNRKNITGILLVTLFWLPLLLLIFSKNQAVYRYSSGLIIPSVFLAAFSLERILLYLEQLFNKEKRWVSISVIGLVIGVNFSHIQPIYNVGSAWVESALWIKSQGESQVISLAEEKMWSVLGIETVDPSDSKNNVKYVAVYKRYESEVGADFIEQYRKSVEPVFATPHNRCEKLFEKQFLENSLVSYAFESIPVIGSHVVDLKRRAQSMNSLHRLEIYELDIVNK